MSSENNVHTKHGNVKVFEQLLPKKDLVEVTFYFKADESKWRYFVRNEATGEVESKEVNWNNYLLGGRTFRVDMTAPRDWFNWTSAAKKAAIEHEIDKLYQWDDIWGYHVERVNIDSNYEKWSDENLWNLECYLDTRIGQLEIELRDLKREYAAVWRVGDKNYDWAERL